MACGWRAAAADQIRSDHGANAGRLQADVQQLVVDLWGGSWLVGWLGGG